MRTTPLLSCLDGQVTWITDSKNAVLIEGIKGNLRCLPWGEHDRALATHYDLAINLEDTVDVAQFLKKVDVDEIFGAYLKSDGPLSYTDNSRDWFDLSLISSYGKLKADKLKFRNRKTYQELVFEGLGFKFAGETYVLPASIETGLSGDVALAPDSGAIWPMKKWAHYGALKQALEDEGVVVNILQKRGSLLEHLADVKNHHCLVGGDSLPMHLALGSAVRCVSLFTCTSPWEIYGYGLQTKIVSPLLEEFFYQRGYDERAMTAIGVEEVFGAVMAQLEAKTSAATRTAVS